MASLFFTLTVLAEMLVKQTYINLFHLLAL